MIRTLGINGFPGITQKVTCADAAALLTLPTHEGLSPIGALITVEDFSCRLAFGTAPTAAALGHKLVAGQSFRMYSPQECSDLQHINETPGSNAVLMITYYFAY